MPRAAARRSRFAWRLRRAVLLPALASTPSAPLPGLACARGASRDVGRHLRCRRRPYWPGLPFVRGRAACRRRCAPASSVPQIAGSAGLRGARMLITSRPWRRPRWRPPTGPGSAQVIVRYAPATPFSALLALGTMPRPWVARHDLALLPYRSALDGTLGAGRRDPSRPGGRPVPARRRSGSPRWTSSVRAPVR